MSLEACAPLGPSPPRPIRVPTPSGEASVVPLPLNIHRGLLRTSGRTGGPGKRIPSLGPGKILRVSQHTAYFRDGKTNAWRGWVLAQDHKKPLPLSFTSQHW